MSGGVLSYVDAKSVERNEAAEPFSSARSCIKLDSRTSKLATAQHIASTSTTSSTPRFSCYYTLRVKSLRACAFGSMLAQCLMATDIRSEFKVSGSESIRDSEL